MSYVDYQILGLDEATTAVETGAADLKTYTFPVGATVEAFGVVITEDFVTHDADTVFSLDHLDKIGGTRTEKAALTLGSSNANLKAGDGTKAGQTAISADADLDNGDVVFADRDNFPFEVLPGESIVFEHKTASGSAGGEAKPFVLIRVGGERNFLSNVWMEVD